MIKFILISNDPILASRAEKAGIGRIFVDLERLGKKERQGHLDTHITNHTIDDVAKVKSRLDQAELLVRLNPLNEATPREVEEAIVQGEVMEFVKMVDGRAKVIPLLETSAAVQSVRNVVQVPGVSEIYIGLNDLHLDLGLRFMFEPLANGLVDDLAGIIKKAGLPFGFGGIARVGEGIIPGEMVLGEHLRLGSSSVILSRTFQRNLRKISRRKDPESGVDPSEILTVQIRKLKFAYQTLELRSKNQVEADSRRLRMLVRDHVETKASETPA
jgi:hypothetical protein